MDSRKNKFRPRGGRSWHNQWRNQSPGQSQNHPNPFHQRHGRKPYRQNDDFDFGYGEYGNSYNSRDRPNFYSPQNDGFHNRGNSIKDFFYRESNTRLPGASKPPEESPWSEEAQEQAVKKKLSDVANRLKNKLKSLNAEEDSEAVQNETESDSSLCISDHIALLTSDQQKLGSLEEGNREEPSKRTAHVPKPFLPPQSNQPETRRRSNDQKERSNFDSMSNVAKVRDVQRNIQRKVIGELLSMPKTSLQMVLDDPKINPKIELGMSHLVKENRLLLAQKFRNLAESKMTNSEHFKESQFVSDVEMFIDPDLAVDLYKLPPEVIKQMGAMFQLDFESDTMTGYLDDNSVGNSVAHTDLNDMRVNDGSANVNKSVQNSAAPKYARYLKKKTENEKSTGESVKPLSEILSNLRTTPENELKRNDVIQSPVGELTEYSNPVNRNQVLNDKVGSIQVRDLMSLLKVGSMQSNMPAPEFDKSPLHGITKEDAALLPKNLNQTFCDNIPLLEKCLESSPLKSDQSVRSDASLPRSEAEIETVVWNADSRLKEKPSAKPVGWSPRDKNIELQKHLRNDETTPRIAPRKDLFKEDYNSPSSQNVYNDTTIESPDISPCAFDYESWIDDDDITEISRKDKNQNVKEKVKPLSLAEKLKNMEEVQNRRSKKDGKWESHEIRKKVRIQKCKNFLESLEQVPERTRNLKNRTEGLEQVSGPELNESILVEDNSNLSEGLGSIRNKGVIEAPKIEKFDKTVQVDIPKNEPITLFSIETALANYVKNNSLNLEPLKKVFNSHVKDLHKNCKKIVPTDIRFTQTEIKEFETSFTQTEKPPEKIFKTSSSQTETPAKILKRPAGTQTLPQTDNSTCYGVPVPKIPAEETSENLLAEVKMIEKVVHKLNERKFGIFLKLTNLNNGSLSFASDGDLSTTLLHTITNGDTNVWKHIFSKEQSKPQERRRERSRDRDKGHSHSRRHESSKKPHESKSNDRKDKKTPEKKKEERRGSDAGKMKTKAELKSVSLSQLESAKDNLHLKKWLESQDPTKYENVEDKKERMSDAGSKRSKKDGKSHENRSERSESENRKGDKSGKSEVIKSQQLEKSTKEIKPVRTQKISEKSKKSNDVKSPPAKKPALDIADKKRKEPEEAKPNENITLKDIGSESVCREPEIQQLFVNLKALERDLNEQQKCHIENSIGACSGPEVPSIIDLAEENSEQMEITSTVDDLISKIQIDETEPEKTSSRPTRPRRNSLKNDEKSSKRTRNKSEDGSVVQVAVPEASNDVTQVPAKKVNKPKKKTGENAGKKGRKPKAKKGKKTITPAPSILETNGEPEKETENPTDSQKPEEEIPPVALQAKRKRTLVSSDADSDVEVSTLPPKNVKKKRRGSKVDGQTKNSAKRTKKGVPERFKKIIANSSSESEMEVESEKVYNNSDFLLKDCCVVIKRLNLPISKVNIPNSENKLVSQEKRCALDEKTKDDCDNKLSEGNLCEDKSETVEKDLGDEKPMDVEVVEERVEKEAEVEKEVGVLAAENEAGDSTENETGKEAVEKIADESQVVEEVSPVEENLKNVEVAEENLVENEEGNENVEKEVGEKSMEVDSEAVDLAPLDNIPAVPLSETLKSNETDEDVLVLTINDSLTETREADSALEDNTLSNDNDAFDAPTISDCDGKRGDFDSSTVSDYSQQTLPVPNGDSLSRNSEGTPTGSKKRRVNPISFSCHKGTILDVKIRGKHLFAACDDKLVYCYSIKSGKRKKEYSGHNDAVTCIAFLSGKKETTDGYLFTGSLDSQVRSFVIKTSALAKQSVVLTGQVQCLEENWGIVFAGLKNGVVMRLNSKTLKVINPPLDVSRQSVMALKTIMEGPRRVFITATRKEPITIRDANDGLLLRTIDYNFDGTVYSLTIDSNNIYCGTSMPKLFAFDFTDGRNKEQYECGPGVLSIKLVQHLIFSSSYDGKIYVTDSKTKERIGIIPGPGKMLMAMDIYKNRQIVASSNDGKLETWAIPAYIRNLLKKVPNG